MNFMRIFFIIFLLFSSFEIKAQYYLNVQTATISIVIDSSKNNYLTFYLSLRSGIPNDTFSIKQSFEDNPGYVTPRVKGKFTNGLLTDSLTVYNNRGQIIEKGFFTDSFHGIQYQFDGKLDTVSGYGRYGLMGYRHGKFTWYKSGKNYPNYKKESEAEYKNGFKEGIRIVYHPDGTILTWETFHNDTLHGKYIQNFSDGIPYVTGFYKIGLKDSLWCHYHPSGKLADSCTYKGGERHSGYAAYYENGQLLCYLPYQKGIMNGTVLYYFSDGKPRSRQGYSDNEWHGESLEWYHNGQLKWKAIYENGLRIGGYEYYDSTGHKMYLGSGSAGVVYPDYLSGKYEFSPPAINYLPTMLNLKYTFRNRDFKLLSKAGKSVFACEIKDKKIIRISLQSNLSELSRRKSEKIINYLMENTSTPGIYYNNALYDGTVTFTVQYNRFHWR